MQFGKGKRGEILWTETPRGRVTADEVVREDERDDRRGAGLRLLGGPHELLVRLQEGTRDGGAPALVKGSFDNSKLNFHVGWRTGV